MKRKLFKKIILTFALAAVCVFTSVIPTYAATEGGTDLANTNFTEDQRAVPFVAYIYIEDDAENNYDNPNRDVTIYFGGAGESYITAHNYQFKDSDSFAKDKVIRVTGKLPTTGDYDYYPTIITNDRKAAEGNVYYIGKFNNTDYSMEDFGNGIKPSELGTDYNEFVFVGGSYDWVSTEGKKKLDEVYSLYHSNTGNLSESAAESAVYDEELFTYWQEQMNADPSIEAWRDDNTGNVYTREDMRKLGYAVVDGTSTTEEEKEEEEEDSAETSSEMTAEKSTEASTEAVIPTEELKTSKGIPPLVIIIIGGFLIIAAVVIAYIKREKNESDLYID